MKFEFFIDICCTLKPNLIRQALDEAKLTFTANEWQKLNTYTISSDKFQNCTLLFYAAEYGWEDVAEILIAHGANVRQPFRCSEGALEPIGTAAKNKHWGIVKKILDACYKIQNTVSKDFGSTMQSLWTRYFSDDKPPQLLSIIKENTSAVIKSLNDQHLQTPADFMIKNDGNQLLNYSHSKTLPSVYQGLFTEELLSQSPALDKKSRLKIAIAESFEIIANESLSVSLLSDFEQILEKNWHIEFEGKAIRQSLHCNTRLKKYAGFFWPVPTESMQKPSFSKNGFLDRQCINFMKQRGLAQQCHKIYASTFDGTFEKIIASGDFFTECSLDPHLLTHGKNIHNIGRILLIIAWEKNLISRKFHEDGDEKELTMHDLFAALVNPEFANPATKYIPWQSLFDLKRPQMLSMSDPWQMHPLLMVACKNSLPYLSMLMRHSFCKAIFKIRDFINDTTGEQWTAPEVWDRYIAIRVPYVVSTSAPYIISWLKDKRKIPIDSPLSKEKPVTQHRLSIV